MKENMHTHTHPFPWSVVNTELQITHWQPCRDRQSLHCIKPEHKAHWTWFVMRSNAHLPREKLGFITHSKWQLGPRPFMPWVSWFSFCPRCFHFLARTARVKCFSHISRHVTPSPVTSISQSPGIQIALPCAFGWNRKSFSLTSFFPCVNEQEVCSTTHRGREETLTQRTARLRQRSSGRYCRTTG